MDGSYIRRLNRAQRQTPQRSPQGVFDGRDETGRIILKTAGGGTAYLSEPVPVARYAGFPVVRTGKVAL